MKNILCIFENILDILKTLGLPQLLSKLKFIEMENFLGGRLDILGI